MSHEISDIAGAEAVVVAEGNMCGTATRGADALPGSKTISRTEGSRRNLGNLRTEPQAERPCGTRREDIASKPTTCSEKSDPLIIATKLSNKTGKPAAEMMEQRGGAGGSASQRNTSQAQSWIGVSRELERTRGAGEPIKIDSLEPVRRLAKENKDERFISLLHHVNPDRLRKAYFAVKRNAAPGIDKITWKEYGKEDLDRKLIDLHNRIHLGTYRATPARRQYIPKPDGTKRPLAIAALEDKIAQRAVADIIEAIYETDFTGFSYGFRPGRGTHDAMDALIVGIEKRKVNWILDIDIQKFFDSVDHEWLIKFLEHRIADRRIIRLIQKWLKVGVMEDDEIKPNEVGTAQGAVISPILANVFLHYVFDLWAVQWRGRKAKGDMVVVRYADDMVLGFQYEADARCFRAEMQERLSEFKLTLHPKKTRLIEFGRFATKSRARKGLGKPETFTFLGFTFICSQTQAGKFAIKRTTRKDRMKIRLKEIGEKLKRRMHKPADETCRWLAQVVRGHYAYFAVPTNYRALGVFRAQVVYLLKRALSKRSQRGWVTWAEISKLANKHLPMPRISHPWPSERFAVRHHRWELGAGKPLAQICAGGGE